MGTKPLGFPTGERSGVLPFGRQRGAYPVDDILLIQGDVFEIYLLGIEAKV